MKTFKGCILRKQVEDLGINRKPHPWGCRCCCTTLRYFSPLKNQKNTTNEIPIKGRGVARTY